MQLPATVMSQELRALGRHRSTMQHLMARAHPLDLLGTQYRMHPEIARFSNASFYHGAVLDADELQTRRYSYTQDWLRHYSVIHFSGEESSSRQRFKICNPQEAQFVVRIAAYLRSKESLRRKSVCILSFYSGQVSCIEALLARQGLLDVRVMTVDSAQGSEADVVILSMVRSGQSVGFLRDFQRLNVSLTRARHLQLVVGDTVTMTRSNVDNLANLVADAKDRRRYFDSFELEHLLPELEE